MSHSCSLRSGFLPAVSIAAATALACVSPAVCGAEPRVPRPAPAPTTSDENTRLQALFRKGITAFEAGNDQESLNALSEAWAIRRTYDIAAAIAQTELALGRYRDAAEHLDFGLKHFVPGESEKTLEAMRTAFAEVKQHVAALKIQVADEGATIELDGRELGHSPLPSSIFVDPGTHTLRARHGDRQATRQLDAQAGQEYSIRLELADSNRAPATAFQEPPPAAPDRSLVPVVVGAAVAALGAVGSATFGAMASSDGETMQRLREQNGAYGCSDGTASASDCAAQHDAAAGHDTHRNLAIGSAIVGAVGLASIPIYWFWPRAETSPAAKASAGLRMHGAVGVGGVSIVGQF